MIVLNAGKVDLIEYMGGDAAVIRNARRCWRSESRGEDSDQKLINHLISKRHMTPFEAMVFTFDVKAPIFVARQWFRHRVGSFNEVSLRYCAANREFYVPDSGDVGMQAWHEVMNKCMDTYEAYLKFLPKEQARSLLPIGLYTEFYWTVNGSSLLNFLDLRTDKSAQFETRVYAQAIVELVTEVAPMTIKSWHEFRV